MIKIIAFDYAGVIKITKNDLIGKITDYLKITKDEWRKEYFLLNHLINVENQPPEEVFLRVVSKFSDIPETLAHVQNLLAENEKSWKLNIEIIDLIKNLRSQKYHIALLSNNTIKLRQELKDDGIYNLFDTVIISAEVGLQKPDPKIFEYLFSQVNVKSNEVIFIDDSKKSLSGSDEIGYYPILYKDMNSLKKSLEFALSSQVDN